MNRSYPALRGIAILLVILNHTIYMVTKYAADVAGIERGDPLSVTLSAISGLGVYAVPIFLFLSGCFFVYAAGHNDLKSNYKVVWSNVKHVAFPYLIWSVIFYAEILLAHGTRYSAAGYLKNLLTGYPFNFVPLLIFYYLISPLLIRLLRRYGIWVLVLILGYQLLLLAVVSPKNAGFALPGVFRWIAPPVLAAPLAEWAIFFPLGLYLVMNAARLAPLVTRLRWALVFLAALFFALLTLDAFSVVRVPFIRPLCPVPLLALSVIFQRSSIPYVRTLELLGKRAYGLYLTNLLVLDLALFGLQAAIPGVFSVYVLLLPVMFALALGVPLLAASLLETRLKPGAYRYVFG